jgi:hypothetical protein
MLQLGATCSELFPNARMSLPVMEVAHVNPGPPLFLTVLEMICETPFTAVELLTKIPPKVEVPNDPGPFPDTVVFSMSKAASLRRIPPPELLSTVQAVIVRVAPDSASIPRPLPRLTVTRVSVTFAGPLTRSPLLVVLLDPRSIVKSRMMTASEETETAVAFVAGTLPGSDVAFGRPMITGATDDVASDSCSLIPPRTTMTGLKELKAVTAGASVQ